MLGSCLLFSPEDGGHTFLRNVRWLSTDYMALYPRRQNSSYLNHPEYVRAHAGYALERSQAQMLPSQIFKRFHRTDRRSDNALDSYSGDVQFESRQDMGYLEVFRYFPQPLQANPLIIPLLRHNRLLPNPFNSSFI
jgi:hypothetical protein